MQESVLVANRGEIAGRIIHTVRALGLKAVMVYSEAGAELPFPAEVLDRPEFVDGSCDTGIVDRMRAPRRIAHRGPIPQQPNAEKRGTAVADVRAEKVASVWQVVVAEGDRVDEGGTLVILESMKMEFPVPVEEPGTVSKPAVAEGAAVQEGDLLAVVN